MNHTVTVVSKPSVVFDEPVILSRGECECGWRGCWFEAPGNVARSVARHYDSCALEDARRDDVALHAEQDREARRLP